MPRISMSYRRDDSRAITGRIYDRLRDHYGKDSVFIDIDGIRPGKNYKQVIDEALRGTDVLLVMIGKEWLGPRGAGGNRINDLNDPVRLELEAAMRYERVIIPVLTDGASMPGPNEFPEQLQEFSFIHAADIDSGRYFDDHVNSLMRVLDGVIAELEEQRSEAALVEAATKAEQSRLQEDAQLETRRREIARAEEAKKAEETRLREVAALEAQQAADAATREQRRIAAQIRQSRDTNAARLEEAQVTAPASQDVEEAMVRLFATKENKDRFGVFQWTWLIVVAIALFLVMFGFVTHHF